MAEQPGSRIGSISTPCLEEKAEVAPPALAKAQRRKRKSNCAARLQISRQAGKGSARCNVVLNVDAIHARFSPPATTLGHEAHGSAHCPDSCSRDRAFRPPAPWAECVRLKSQKEIIMPRGDKSSYSSKQKRKARHIEQSYEKRGVGSKEAAARAWATVNKQSGGGEKSGSGRRKSASSKAAARRGSARRGVATKRGHSPNRGRASTRKRKTRKTSSRRRASSR
jgi:hypothetical protein